MTFTMEKLNRVGGRRLELVCVLCNESLADLEKTCAAGAGVTYNISKNQGKNNNNATVAVGDHISSETDTALADTGGGGGGTYRLPTPRHGGYLPATNEGQKDVVATKCGHMFHQGCLRKHVHKTLIEGKGGSLFCPICTRPFAMNRLWPVIIPPTRAQRERYVQLKMMKQQNGDMVKQLKEIRAKIAEEESRLSKIKEESEECLEDIQQKQKLLDSVNGPTNKEMVELTKMHMKRQEILHVVTQHNADLLKLLAEESNISTSTAEKMINVKNNNHYQNNVLNSSTQHILNYNAKLPHHQQSRRSSKNKVQFENTSELYLPLQDEKKGSKKDRKKSSDKSKRKSSKKKSKRQLDKELREDIRKESEMLPITPRNNRTGGGSSSRGSLMLKQNPSEVMPMHETIINAATKEYPILLRNTGSRPVDTVMKWNMESVRELMSSGNLSDESEINLVPAGYENRGGQGAVHFNQGQYNERNSKLQQPGSGGGTLPILKFPQKNSTNIMLARKAPIILNKNIYDDSRKVKK